MAAKNWPAANKRVRAYEGGNVDDPRDPGGRTSRGITQGVYTAWRRRNGHAARDVFLATEKEVSAIYKQQYWDAVQGDELPGGVDLVLYDGAVNSGPKQSIKWLQAALNAKRKGGVSLAVDGVLGNVTLDSVEDNPDHDLLIGEIAARRMGFLKRLKTWKHFGKGWSPRVSNVMKAGQALATGSVGPAPDVAVPAKGGNAKAEAGSLKAPLISVQTGAGASGTGVTLSTVNELVSGAAGQVQAVADVSETLRWIFIALTIVGIGISAYAAWRAMRLRRAVDGEARAPVEEAA